MIDLFNDNLMTLAEATEAIPGRPSRRTLFRWIDRGFKAQDGSVVKLESTRVGAKRMTSREAVQRFTEQLARPRATSASTRATRTRDSELDRRLAEKGL